jgi:aldehyde:ferredoxin oxidoreductase
MMKIGGYAGSILRVDLSTGDIETEPLDMELARKFIGAEGINFRWAYDLIPPKLDPYAEACPIILGAGPMVGTPVPASSRAAATFKHPNYGGVIENSRAGGDLGPMLKWAGYDYVIVTGKSEKPVYLNIHNEDATICDASHIWGKDTYETTDILWERHDDACVLTIGPAGERLVKTTVCLIDKVHTMGKGGLPAVMGSKNLKAIVVSGSKGVKVANPERLKAIVLPLMQRISSNPNLKRLISMGTMVGFAPWFERQGGSYKNWTETFPVDEAFRLYGTHIYEKEIRNKRIPCFSCPAACKDKVSLRDGEFAGLETYGSSLYGRLENIAVRCNVGSYNRFVKCLDYFQRMGLCIHELTGLIDWAIDLYKHGIITKEDTGGLELSWDFDTTMKLLQQVAMNEGFGSVLGDGMLSAIEKIGKGSDTLAIHVKGMVPLYDARVNRLSNVEFGQVVNPRGGHPGRAGIPGLYMSRDLADAHLMAKAWAERNALPKDALNRIFERPGRYNIGRLTKWAQERRLIFNSLGIGCGRERGGASFSMEDAAEINAAVTGFEIDANELLEIAHRSFNLLKVLNLREGFTREDDKFPDRWFESMVRHGEKTYLEDYFGKRLLRRDCEKILDDYYDECGWDIKLGIPTRKKVMDVGLEDVARNLTESGFLPA